MFVEAQWKFISVCFYDFLFFYFLFCFFLYLKISSELPNDGDFLGSLLLVWWDIPTESRLLKFLQCLGKDEEGWGG